MSEPNTPVSSSGEAAWSVVGLLVDQRERWQRGERILVEAYLQRLPGLESNTEAVLDLIGNELLLRQEQGETPMLAQYQRRFPQWTAQIAIQFEVERAIDNETLTQSEAPSIRTLEPFPPASAPSSAPSGYEILEELGRGGQSIVHKARQLGLNRLVAVKQILAGSRADVTELARFRTEAEAIAQLQHPNVVQIHEVGERDGMPFLCLEFVGGGSLAQRLVARPLPVRDAVLVVETVARAMHVVHQHGIVHRDLKPANVLLTTDGVPKVTDFGLAKRLEGPAGHTQSGDVLGTPAYMAPEQAAGRLKEVGPLADVYALGAILYECLTGRPPFRAASTLETLQQVLIEEPVPPRRLQPKVHRDLETICLKCLAKEPRRRYGSALALSEDLARFNAGEAIHARPDALVGKLWRKARRRPLVPAAAVLILLAAAVAGYLVWLGSSGLREQGLLAGQRAELRGKLEAGLQAEAWPVRHEQEMDALLEELRRADDPDQADLARRVTERFAQIVDGAIGQARLSPADVQAIEEALRRLAARAPDQAAARRKALATRLTEWDTVFELKPPFAAAREVFGAAPLRVDKERLLLQPIAKQGAAAVNSMLLTHYPCEGNVRLETVVDLEAGPFRGISLLLNAAPAHAQTITCLAFSPDGALLASASWDGTVKLWDARTGQLCWALREPAGAIFCLAFNPDGRTLATGSNKVVGIWDAATGKQAASWQAHQGDVLTLAFSADGQVLASGGTDRTARLWDAATGAARGKPREHPEAVICLTLADGGRTLATLTSGNSRLVRREDLATGARQEFHAPFRDGETRFAAFAPDARLVAGITFARDMGLWEVPAGKERPTLPGSYGPLAFSSDGKLLARARSHQDISDAIGVWEVSTGRRWSAVVGHPSGVCALAFSADGSTLAAAGVDGILTLWDAATGKQRLNLGGRTYAFVVSHPLDLPGAAGPVALPKGAKAAYRLQLAILRDGSSQRVQVVTFPGSTRSLRLRASREDNLLTFQVNELPPLVFEDLFGLAVSSAGVFGLSTGPETPLTWLRASRQARPIRKSPLEQGDELTERGRFAEALDYFQEQARKPGAAAVAAEARCKAALCLLRLNRPDEAARLLEETSADAAGGNWALVASAQLLLLRLNGHRLDADTDALLESLSGRYKAEELIEVIPDNVRLQILRACDVAAVDYLFFREAHLQKLQRAFAIAERFGSTWSQATRLQVQLLHAYSLLGRDKEALVTAQGVLKRVQERPSSDWNIGPGYYIEEACWAIRRCGDRQTLLRDVEQMLRQGSAASEAHGIRPLLVERARIHAALGDWAAAAKDLDVFFQTPAGPPPYDYTYFSSACLMNGFLCERRGDAAAALRFWQRGLFKSWRKDQQQAGSQHLIAQSDPKAILHSLILGSLAGDLADDEVEESLGILTASASSDSPVMRMLKAFRLPPAAFREMWRSPRGKAYAQKIAFRDLSLTEFVRVPPFLATAETLRLGSLAAPASAEQDELLWGLVQETFAAYDSGKLKQHQLLQIGLAWKGTTGLLGWGGVSGGLAPSLRGPLAYILGHRYLRLNRPDDAAMFFRTASVDAAPGSPLRRLAGAEVERLKKR